MKKINKVIAAVIVMAAFATSANAQSPAQAQASAYAKIVPAIQIANSRALSFGNIITGTGGGTVSIDAANVPNRQKTGANVILAAGTVSSAKFTVTGDGAATYAITRTPASGSDLTLTHTVDNTKTMLAALVVSAGGTNAETTTGLLGGTSGSSGTQDIYVGGTLTVSATQTSGSYQVANGITISVDYN